MIVAVDSSVLFSVWKGESAGEQWLDKLVHTAAIGKLIVCEIVVAELGGYFESPKNLHESLENLNISIVHSTVKTCHYAGKIFKNYRKEGGKREHLIPDFLIGSHAHNQADKLFAEDRGYLRKYFSKLKVEGL